MTLAELRKTHERNGEPMAYWSKASAEAAAKRFEKAHDHLIAAVDYSLTCDGRRDWTVHLFNRPEARP